MKRRIISAVVMLLLSFVGTSYATHPLVSDDAGTLGKGTIQIELNGDIGTDKDTNEAHTTKTTSSQIASTIGVGVSDKIDFTFGFTRPWSSGDVDGVSFKSAGTSDFFVNMKWQLYEHESFSVALKPQFGYSYVVGASENDHTMSYGTTLILTKEMEPFAFHLNFGYTYNDFNLATEQDANRNSIWNFSFATTYDVIKERLKIVADFGVATNQDRTLSEMPVFGLAGLIYSFNKNVDLSAGIKIGLTKPETDLTGTFGVTLKF